MKNYKLTEEQWAKIWDFLNQTSGIYVGQEADCRKFIEAILWITRTGAPWRNLPAEFGKWNSVYKRYRRWSEKGVAQKMMEFFGKDADKRHGMLDRTIVRAHACAAGAPKKRGKQALGRSRGGFSTKIHVLVDAMGRPLRLRLTAGQRHDITQAEALLEGFHFGHVIADRAYAAQKLHKYLLDRGMQPVIPPHPRAKNPPEYDTKRYGERNWVERFIGKLKHYRRLASRFEKLDTSHLGFLHFASALIWLR